MKKSNLEIIRKYLAGNLQAEELHEFEKQMDGNLKFAQEVLTEKLLIDAMEQIAKERSANVLLKAQDLVKSLGMDLFTSDEQTQLDKIDFKTNLQVYSISDLVEDFAVSEEFESYTTRSANGSSQTQLQVLSPENEASLSGEMNIVLKTELEVPLVLNIKNNKGEIILQNYQLPSKQTSFTVPLPSDIKPGRYYWQLKAQVPSLKAQHSYGIVLRSFFIGKELLG